MRARLDTELVARGLTVSREQAKRLILAGAVRVNGQLAGKASDTVVADADVQITSAEKFVSRGGHNLEAALTAFQMDPTGKRCVDIGASTGGFTDCLLQHGASHVHAVDVGKGQLAWKLRQDPRVTVQDEVNARNLLPSQIGTPVDLVTIDTSFISLTKILPAAEQLLRPGGELIALIKPQFEAGRADVGKGGVVRDAGVHERVQAEVIDFATRTLGLRLVGRCESPLLGPAGNKEFLVGFTKP